MYTNSLGPIFKPIARTQRHPQYSDTELKPFFDEVGRGYCFNQSADRSGLDRKTLWNTLYSDDETLGYALDLSMHAGALIKAGALPIPDRHDGLYSP
jgi:hypothetical protein